MARGDHLRVKRLSGAYYHHGIDLGKGRVIHYSGQVGRKRNASIREASRSQFAEGGEVEVVEYAACDHPNTVIARARSRLGENGYHLFGNNCEHFARWCKTGQHKSEQVSDAASATAGSVGAGALAAGGLGVVAGTGAAAGLSGAGIMSGLATVGGVVGGGAVAGVAVLGAAPVAVTTLAMRKVLEDDPSLKKSERKARQAGRTATVVGGAAGAAGTIGTIAAVGTTAGLSGAGITSGLAAIGAAVGGGMAAGTVIAVAAPAAAAAAVGYGAYRAWKWLSD